MKAKVKATGKEVEAFFDNNMSKECHTSVWQTLIDGELCYFHERELDFIEKDKNYIYWEQRRYEIAKECVAVLMRNEITLEDAAKLSVEQADALITELKKKNKV